MASLVRRVLPPSPLARRLSAQSISGLVIFALAVPLGRAADRVGSKRMWALCALAVLAAVLMHPAVRSAQRHLAPTQAQQPA